MNLSYFLVSGQEVLNIEVKQEGKQILINYDLVGGRGDVKMEIRLYYRQRDGDWREIISGVSGEIGKEVSGGKGKNIRWSPLQENGKLTGEGFQFKVSVNVAGDDAYWIGGMNMVWVEGGSFDMGCTSEQGNECEEDEKPSHGVYVSSFYMSKYEVTQTQWVLIMGSNPGYFKGCDECPVINVSWYDAQEFIEKLNKQTGGGYRLPTEAEWEYAARGGIHSKGFKYSGGNDIERVGWYDVNSEAKTHIVGLKTANEIGLYDMSGNVWEWCQDWYGENYYNKSSSQDPPGPLTGEYRVVRGGSRGYGSGFSRVAGRIGYPQVNRHGSLGFRLAKD